MTQEILENLRSNGFTEYEAKAYVALVGLGMATAREVCEASGVPQGRIYDVLKQLTTKGYLEVQEGSPTRYRAGDPEVCFNSLKEDFCQTIDKLIIDLKKLHYDTKLPSPFWSIHSDSGIQNRLKTLIRNAKEELIIIVRDPETLRGVVKDLKRARKRVNIYILVDKKDKYSGMNLRVHEMSETLIKFFSEMNDNGPEMRMITGWYTAFYMVIDGREAITVGQQSEKRIAIITTMPPYCYMIKRLIEMLDPSVGR